MRACTPRLLIARGVAASGVVDDGDGVGGEQGVGAACDGGVVPDVVGGFGVGHRWHGVAHADALVQGGQDAQAHALPEGGLSDQEHGKG